MVWGDLDHGFFYVLPIVRAIEACNMAHGLETILRTVLDQASWKYFELPPTEAFGKYIIGYVILR